MALALIAGHSTEAMASPAESGSTRARKAPKARVAAIMTSTNQALLWDIDRSRYVLVRVGSRFRRFVVTEINRLRVVLTHRRTRQSFVLPRTGSTAELAEPPAKSSAQPPAQPADASAPSNDQANVADPYGAPPVTPPAPVIEPGSVLDPYGPAVGVSGPSTAAGPGQSEPRLDSTTILDPYASPEIGTATNRRVTRKKRFRVSRRKLEAAVTDFERLGNEVQLAISDDGAHIHSVARSSLFYRLGFRAGDLVISVDGRPIRSMDDAAVVYAQLASVKRFVVIVQRGLETVELRYRFTR